MWQILVCFLCVWKKSELQVSGNYTKAVVTVAVCVDELVRQQVALFDSSRATWRCMVILDET